MALSTLNSIQCNDNRRWRLLTGLWAGSVIFSGKKWHDVFYLFAACQLFFHSDHVVNGPQWHQGKNYTFN